MDTFMLPVLVGLLILVCIAALIIDEYKKEIEKEKSEDDGC